MRPLLPILPAAANGDHNGGEISSQVQATICTGLVQSLCLQNLHPSDHCVLKPKPKLLEGCHAGVQFSERKTT